MLVSIVLNLNLVSSTSSTGSECASVKATVAEPNKSKRMTDGGLLSADASTRQFDTASAHRASFQIMRT